MSDNQDLMFFDGSEENLHEDLASYFTKKEVVEKTPTKSDVDPDDDITDSEDTVITDKVDEKKEPEIEQNNNDDPITTKFKTLVEMGYLELPEDYEAPKTEEELEKAVEDSKKYRQEQAVAALWEALPDAGKPLLEYLLEGGTDIAKFQKVYSKGLDLEKVDITDPEVQKQVLKTFYLKKGFSEQKAAKQVEVSESLMELENDSKEAFDELLVLDKKEKEALIAEAKADAEAREKAQRERWSILNNTLNSTDDFGGGYVIGKKAKPKAIESLYKQIRTENNEVMSEFNYKLRHVVLQDPKLTLVLSDILNRLTTDKKSGSVYFDLSHLSERAETKVTKGLSDKLDRLADAGNHFKAGSIATKSNGGDWDSVL